MSILTLKIRLTGWRGDRYPWTRIIEIPEEASLEELHFAIQELTGFDNDHMYEFYAGRSPNQHKIEFGSPASPYEPSDYEQVLLCQVYPLNRLKLYYLFDFGDRWTFEISRRPGSRALNNKVKYPRIVEKSGRKLRQYG